MTESRAGTRPHIPGYISALSGATAGLIAGIVVCPLDVVKTRLQVQGFQQLSGPGAGSRGVLTTLLRICREEGMRGLYSGLGPLCVGYLPSWGIYFYVYKSMQKMFPSELHAGGRIHENSSGHAKGDTSQWTPVHNWGPAVSSAVVAGACSTVATNPIWMIKTRLMAQSKTTSWQYAGMVDAARTIYRLEGWRAFYSGLGSAFLGLPHVAIHFPLYERLKRMWAPRKQWQGILAASIFSKIIASTITYPHEVVRSRNQIRSEGNKYRGVWRTVRTLWIEEGWRAFYSGLTANVCRAIPSSAVTLLTFELVSASLAKHYAERSELSASREKTYQLAQTLEASLDAANQITSPSNPLIDVFVPEED